MSSKNLGFDGFYSKGHEPQGLGIFRARAVCSSQKLLGSQEGYKIKSSGADAFCGFQDLRDPGKTARMRQEGWFERMGKHPLESWEELGW